MDYGNTESVSSDSVRELLPALAELPVQAIKCSLDIPESGVSTEVKEKFSSLIFSESAMSIRVLRKEGDLHVVQLSIDGQDLLLSLTPGTYTHLSTCTLYLPQLTVSLRS